MAITPKSEDKYVEKCSTAQSFIRTEMSTYRIGTLVNLSKICLRVRPSVSKSDHDIGNILFVFGSYEYLVRLEGKIRDGIFFCVNKSDNNSVKPMSIVE